MNVSDMYSVQCVNFTFDLFFDYKRTTDISVVIPTKNIKCLQAFTCLKRSFINLGANIDNFIIYLFALPIFMFCNKLVYFTITKDYSCSIETCIINKAAS